jgi:hypothetical protein
LHFEAELGDEVADPIELAIERARALAFRLRVDDRRESARFDLYAELVGAVAGSRPVADKRDNRGADSQDQPYRCELQGLSHGRPDGPDAQDEHFSSLETVHAKSPVRYHVWGMSTQPDREFNLKHACLDLGHSSVERRPTAFGEQFDDRADHALTLLDSPKRGLDKLLPEPWPARKA